MRQVPRENAELRTTFVENLCPTESPPLQGVQDSSGKGFVYQNGFAKMALELFGPHDPVVIEWLMHLECRVVGIQEASWIDLALGKASDFL